MRRTVRYSRCRTGFRFSPASLSPQSGTNTHFLKYPSPGKCVAQYRFKIVRNLLMLCSGRMTVAVVAGIVIGFRPLNPRVVRPADSILNVAAEQRIGDDALVKHIFDVGVYFETSGIGRVNAIMALMGFLLALVMAERVLAVPVVLMDGYSGTRKS